MRYHYRDLLPSYLEGPNIDKHSQVIDSYDTKLYADIERLRGWNNLNRPILIEKIQTGSNNAKYVIHIHTDEPITSIDVSGDYTYNETHEETEFITQKEITFYTSIDDITTHKQLAIQTGLVNADFTVTVQTSEENTYIKSYPENDTVENTNYDHDEMLDKIGALLNIPRRLYNEYTLAEITETIPTPYVGKQANNDMIQQCTEDDYYYTQRLQKFIEGYGSISYPLLMLDVVFEQIGAVEYNNATLTEHMCRMDVSSFDEKFMAIDSTEYNNNLYSFFFDRQDYPNFLIPSMEELEGIIQEYVPVTKQVSVGEIVGTNMVISDSEVQLLTENGEPVYAMLVELRLDDEFLFEDVTDSNGKITYALPTLSGGIHHLTAIFKGGATLEQAYNSCEASFDVLGDTILSMRVIDDDVLSPQLEVAVVDAKTGLRVNEGVVELREGNTLLDTVTLPNNNLFPSGLLADVTYNLTFKFKNNINYKENSITRQVQLKQYRTIIEIDTTDLTQFMTWNVNNTHTNANVDGYISTTSGYATTCKQPLQRDMTIHAEFDATTSQNVSNAVIGLLQRQKPGLTSLQTEFKEDLGNNKLVERHEGTQIGIGVAPAHTEKIVIDITIDKNGWIYYKNELGNEYTSNIGFTDEELGQMEFGWQEFVTYGLYLKKLTYTISKDDEAITRIIADTTTTVEWGVVSDGEELLSDLPTVDVHGVHSGTYRWVYWKKPVPYGASLSVEGTITNTSNFTICGIIGDSPTRYPNNSSERMVGARELDIFRDSGSIELQYFEITLGDLILRDTVVIPTLNSNFTLEIVPKMDSTDVYVDGVKYTTGALLGKNGDVPDSYYYRLRKWNNGEIIVHHVEYEVSNDE